jgi:hypothetical protein
MRFSDMTHDEMLERLRSVTRERDSLREQLEAESQSVASIALLVDSIRANTAMLQREHAAILADASAARERAERERDTLRRQVEAMSAPIAAACGRFGHLDMVLEMAHDPDGTENTNPWHACARDLWRAVKAAKEGGGK